MEAGGSIWAFGTRQGAAISQGQTAETLGEEKAHPATEGGDKGETQLWWRGGEENKNPMVPVGGL